MTRPNRTFYYYKLYKYVNIYFMIWLIRTTQNKTNCSSNMRVGNILQTATITKSPICILVDHHLLKGWFAFTSIHSSSMIHAFVLSTSESLCIPYNPSYILYTFSADNHPKGINKCTSLQLLQSVHIKFQLEKIELQQNTIVSASWKIVTGTWKYFYWIQLCVNLWKQGSHSWGTLQFLYWIEPWLVLNLVHNWDLQHIYIYKNEYLYKAFCLNPLAVCFSSFPSTL